MTKLTFSQRAKLARLRLKYQDEIESIKDFPEDEQLRTLLTLDMDREITETIEYHYEFWPTKDGEIEKLQIVMAIFGRFTGQLAKLCDKYQRGTTKLLLTTFEKAFEQARKERQEIHDREKDD